ncbi:MAG: hypothetical protein ACR2OU_06170 [Thermomicrobiales bacterium]
MDLDTFTGIRNLAGALLASSVIGGLIGSGLTSFVTLKISCQEGRKTIHREWVLFQRQTLLEIQERLWPVVLRAVDIRHSFERLEQNIADHEITKEQFEEQSKYVFLGMDKAKVELNQLEVLLARIDDATIKCCLQEMMERAYSIMANIIDENGTSEGRKEDYNHDYGDFKKLYLDFRTNLAGNLKRLSDI